MGLEGLDTARMRLWLRQVLRAGLRPLPHWLPHALPHALLRALPQALSRALVRALLPALAIACAPAAQSQDYPSKTIKIVVPVPPGAAVDRMARLVADVLQGRWGQAAIVESRGGAAGNIGAEYFAKSAPDGHTLMLTAASVLVINRHLYSKLAYDPESFVPVTIVAISPNVLVVHPKVEAETLQQFIAHAKANPNRLNFGSGGSGSTAHLSAELFTSMAGTSIVHVPYKGSAPAITDLIGGQVQMVFLELGSALPHVRAGRLRALAVGSEKRDSLLPDVPAIAEALPGFASSVWFGVVAPPGTPAAIAGKLSVAIAEALKKTEVAKQLVEMGVSGMGSTPADTALFLRRESERWGKVIRASGTKLD